MSTSLLDLKSLVINGVDAHRSYADLVESLVSLTMRETITGASTVELVLNDSHRTILRSALLSGGSDATTDVTGATVAGSTGLKGATLELDGAGFEVAAVKKRAGKLTLTLEDMAVAELRRRTGQKVSPAGSLTRAEFCASLVREVSWIRVAYAPGAKSLEQLARESASAAAATVPGGPTGWGGAGSAGTSGNVVSGNAVLDTQDRQAALAASTATGSTSGTASALLQAQISALSEGSDLTTAQEKKNREDTWTACTRIMGEINWRVMCRRGGVVFAPDAWLMSRSAAKYTLSESSAGVDVIDLEWDTGKPSATASMTVWAGALDLIPGSPVVLKDMGPGNGTWLVETVDRAIKSKKCTVSLIRPAPQLEEPHDASSNGTGVGGEGGFGVSTVDAKAIATLPVGKYVGAGGNGERFVQAALAQAGKPYRGGGHGPSSFDCSGLVMWAARQVGVDFPAPVSTQTYLIRNAGGFIPVADAVKTRGAILYRGVPGINGGMSGSDHIAISLGDGRTIEARGQAYGVGVFSATKGRDWAGGGIIPGIGYA